MRSIDVVRAALDQIFSPLHIHNLIEVILKLIHSKEKGLFNVAGKEPISRYHLAHRVAALLKMDEKKIVPIHLQDLKETFTRPGNTTLSCKKLFHAVDCEPQLLHQSIKNLINLSRR